MQRCKRLSRFRARRTNSLKNEPEKQDSRWVSLRRRSRAWWARETLTSASRRTPLLPRRDINTVDARVHNVWLVQILEVAFSRRICCSRVARVNTNPRCPSVSTVSPTKRPGLLRTNFFWQAEETKPGQHKF